MRDTAILVPVFALAGWTGLILLLIAARRLTAGLVAQGVQLGRNRPTVPAPVSLPNRNYMNLLELPVLFYVICVLAYVAQVAAPLALPLAWGYVGLRIVHSLIHISYNKVLHRFMAFALSNVVLVVLWIVVGRAVFSG